MARLTEPLNFRKLLEQGATFNVDTSVVNDDGSDSDPETAEKKTREEMVKYINLDCLDFHDEDTYEESEPFERISKKMENLIPDGKIKKRVLREGDGGKPNELSRVKIHYNAYLEHEATPFDSTYARRKPQRFTVNDGRVIAGLDFSVQSMCLNEKAQFLIHPDYAYRNSLIGRIPPNSTVLFEVELLEIIDSAAAITYEQLSEEKQKEFAEIYKYCLALCERAKASVSNAEFKSAIKDYNTAVSKIETASVSNKDEGKLQQDLSLRLFSNLLVCHTRNGAPRKGCVNAEKIYKLTADGELMKISAKIYFNHARCLRILGQYDEAKAVLDKAHKLEPNNPDINNEYFSLEDDKLEHKKKQLAFAKALVGKSD